MEHHYNPVQNRTIFPHVKTLQQVEESLPYPVNALPDIIRDAVVEYQEFGQQPMAIVASAALSVATLACQAHYNVARDFGLIGPISLNFITIASSGERKSSADRYFMKPILDCESEKRKAIEHLLKAWEIEADIYESKLKKLKRELDKSPENQVLQERLRDLYDKAPAKPVPPRLIYEDITKEKLALQISSGWPSAAIMSSEGGSVFGSHSFNKNNDPLGAFALFNKLWDGDVYIRDRATQESCEVRDRRLSCAIMMQFTVLRHLLYGSNGQSRDTGFLARFLISYPASHIGKRPYKSRQDLKQDAYDLFCKRIKEILNWPLNVWDERSMNLKPALLTLSAEAKQIWIDYYSEVELEIGQFGNFEYIKDFGSKSADNAARLAAIFHIVSNVTSSLSANNTSGLLHVDESDETQNMEEPSKIPADTMRKAIAIAYWHLQEAKRIFASTAISKEIKDAQRLLDWIKHKNLTSLDLSYIINYGPNEMRSDKKLRESAIKTLQDHNYLFADENGRKTTYHLHPILIDEFNSAAGGNNE